MPKVLGYAAVVPWQVFSGFSATAWPLQGPALFLLELGVSIVLFECGAAHSAALVPPQPDGAGAKHCAEAALTYGAVYYSPCAGWTCPPPRRPRWRVIAMAGVARGAGTRDQSTRAVGPVTDRAMVLATLSTLYALTLGSAKAEDFARPAASLWQDVTPVLVVLGVSVAVAALLCLAMRLALRCMSPASENTSIFMLALIAGGHRHRCTFGRLCAAGGFAGRHAAENSCTSAPAALAAPVGHRIFTADHADVRAGVHRGGAGVVRSGAIAVAVIALVVGACWPGLVGVGLGNIGSGASWRQAVWVACCDDADVRRGSAHHVTVCSVSA